MLWNELINVEWKKWKNSSWLGSVYVHPVGSTFCISELNKTFLFIPSSYFFSIFLTAPSDYFLSFFITFSSFLLFACSIKGIVSVISSDPPCKDGLSTHTAYSCTILTFIRSLMLTDVVFFRLNSVVNSDSSYMFSSSRDA